MESVQIEEGFIAIASIDGQTARAGLHYINLALTLYVLSDMPSNHHFVCFGLVGPGAQRRRFVC